MNKTPLAIEIFTEADRSNINSDSLDAGVELVKKYADNIVIKPGNRKIRLGKSPNTDINPYFVRWPINLGIPLGIVASDRHIRVDESDSGVANLGFAQAALPKATGFAIVNVQKCFAPDIAAAHEIGHLLHISEHCDSNTCFMYHAEESIETEQIVAKKGIQRLLEMRRLRIPTYETVVTSRQTGFCDPCAEKLGRNAWYLAQAYDGNDTAITWLLKS